MPLIKHLGKFAVPLAGAIFIEPLLNFFAPSVRPLIRQLINNDQARQLLKDLVDSTAVAGPSICTNFLASQADRLLDRFKPIPTLEEALIAALRSAFADMAQDLRKRNKYAILSSFDQFFADWDEKLKLIQTDALDTKHLLETKRFDRLFYEWPEAEAGQSAWWEPVKTELEMWTTYGKIPFELEQYFIDNLLHFADQALTNTLETEKYKPTWTAFQKDLGTQVLSVLGDLKTHIVELGQLLRVASGEFIRDERLLEFPLRKSIDSLIADLVSKEIYVDRDVVTVSEETAEANDLQHFATRDGYFLLAAPAGSGKSTLMARWIRASSMLEGKAKATLCYHFYSKQEGTRDHGKALTILSDQLLKAHQIQANVSSFNPATIDAIINTALGLDHPTRLIIIIDGLDEAGDPSTDTEFLSLFKRIFPQELGKNTTVILTMRDDRGADSLEHYSTELRLPLNGIRMSEVSGNALSSYLTRAADHRLKKKASDQDFIQMIIVKTDGLAIYIYYLIDELLQTEEALWSNVIASLPKGFENYVAKSLPFALKGNPRWEEALSFLSLTLTPLDEGDLIALTKLSGNKLKKADFHTISWQIKRWLRNEVDVWAFSHQKIGEVFREVYVADEQALYMDHLLTYCAAWKEHRSYYVLQNYAKLLSSEQKEQLLYELADNKEFLELQTNELRNNPNAPLRTLQIAMTHAAGSCNAPMMARFSLAHASTVERISAESWFSAYNKRGFQSAIELADNLGDYDRKVIWYLLIAYKLMVSTRQAEAENILIRLDSFPLSELSPQVFFAPEAVLCVLLEATGVDLVKRIYERLLPKSRLQRDFVEAAKYFSQIGHLQKAEEVARSIERAEARILSLQRVAAALVRANDLEKAEAVLEDASREISSIVAPNVRSEALRSLAMAFAHTKCLQRAAELLEEATVYARSIIEPENRSQALKNIAAALIYIKSFEKAKQLLEAATIEARLINDFEIRSRTLKEIGANFVHVKCLDRLKDLLSEAEQTVAKDATTRREELFKELSKALSASDRSYQAKKLLAEAERGAYDNKQFKEQVANLASLAVVLADAKHVKKAEQLFNDAERIARSIDEIHERASALARLAATLADAHMVTKAELLFKEAQEIALSIEDISTRYNTFNNLLRDLAHLPTLKQAKEFYSSISVKGVQNKVIGRLAVASAEAGLFEEAEQAAGLIPDLSQRSQALKDVAIVLAGAHLTESAKRILNKAAQITRTISDAGSRSYGLKEVAEVFDRVEALNESEKVFAEAVQAARSISHSETRAVTLARIGNALFHTGRFDESAKLFSEAEEIARSIEDNRFRFHTLRNIALAYVQVEYFEKAEELFEEAQDISTSTELAQDSSRVNSSFGPSSAIADELMFVDKIWDKASHDPAMVRNTKSYSQALGELASVLARVQRSVEAQALYEHAEESANNITDTKDRYDALVNLVTALANAEFFEDAGRVALSIPDSTSLSRALNNITTALVDYKHFDEAEVIAHSIEEPKARVHALGALAAALTHEKRLNDAKRLFDEAKQIARSMVGTWNKTQVFQSISMALSKDYLLGAVKLVNKIKHQWSRNQALRNISKALARARYYDEAEQVAILVSYPKYRADAFAFLAVELARAEVFDRAQLAFEEAERAANLIIDFQARSESLGKLAVSLVKVESFNEALRIIESIDVDSLLRVLHAFAMAKHKHGLERHIVSLSFRTESSLRACAQMILLYDNQVDSIYTEVRRYV